MLQINLNIKTVIYKKKKWKQHFILQWIVLNKNITVRNKSVEKLIMNGLKMNSTNVWSFLSKQYFNAVQCIIHNMLDTPVIKSIWEIP